MSGYTMPPLWLPYIYTMATLWLHNASNMVAAVLGEMRRRARQSALQDVPGHAYNGPDLFVNPQTLTRRNVLLPE